MNNDSPTPWMPPPESPWGPQGPTRKSGPWATFSSWPTVVQALVWVVIGFFGLGAIGAATGAGDTKPTHLASDTHGTVAPEREEVVPTTEPPTTAAPTTTVYVAPTTVYVPPTTTPYVPPTTRYVPPTTRYVAPVVRNTTPATSPAPASPSAPAPSGCDQNYSGACVPANVSDVDCAGGSGNGPYYVTEKNFQVVGTDHYGLDADHDGIACES